MSVEDSRDVSSRSSGSYRRASPRSSAGQPGGYVVLDQPPHAAEVAQAIEVPDQRHVRVGDRVPAVLLVQLLRCAEHRHVDPDQRGLHPDPVRADARHTGAPARTGRRLVTSAAAGRRSCRRCRGPGGGNTSVCRSNSAPICRGARRAVAVDAMTFGRARLPCASSQVPAGQPPTRTARPSTERPGDQVQLVLDDQVRRAQRRGLLDPPGRLSALGRMLRGVALDSSQSLVMVSAVT